jgi:hypothetical protein
MKQGQVGMFFSSLHYSITLSLLLVVALCGCRAASPQVSPPKPAQVRREPHPPTGAKPQQFTDVTEQAGIRFRHSHGKQTPITALQTTGSGVGWLDYDGDGWLDVYFVNEVGANALYHNNHDGTFSDVTEKAGAGDSGFGMGCCAGDYDNDGDVDLFITNYGSSVLYRNNGNGAFANVTQQAGVNSKRWGAGCAFFDYDKDGFLDLFISHYAYWKKPYLCESTDGVKMGCPAVYYPPEECLLYRNNGNGTFTDVSKASGIAGHKGRGLGVICLDYNNDGNPDVFVANDADPNFLFQNRGNGTFKEVGVVSGVSVNARGNAQSCMGVDFADVDNDGKFDIIVTNFQDDYNTLYHNNSGFFTDVSGERGLTEPTLHRLGWGCVTLDYDNDGDRDLFFANGHVIDTIDRVRKDATYRQTSQLFENRDGFFTDVSSTSGNYFNRRYVGRGAAASDYDNDGDVDIVVLNLHDRPVLLRNEDIQKNNWIKVDVRGKKGKEGEGRGTNRSGIGVRVTVVVNGKQQMDEVRSACSWGSIPDLRLHFGLGKAMKADKVIIRWTTGQIQTFKDVPANHLMMVTEGGTPVYQRLPAR